ncbi:hypothetical protein ACRQ5Q_24280 [Bradyrhizobium sp. PMVTL-01]|uniref:phage adaptor protein n=1 Tax=Bradyrhizobium sp. PMVTL-01 TaxID=3434999 RepID=UPI003F6EB8DB
MARGTTLVKLLDQLRAELHTSLNPAHNNQVRDKQVHFLNKTQEWLWEDYNWPHLRERKNYPVQAGQRFYDFGADFDLERIERIEVMTGGRWLELDQGVDSAHYALQNSELDQRADPVRRWRIAEDEQIELWPIGQTDGDPTTLENYVKVTGIRKLNPLVKDTDRADIDDQLIFLYAASSYAPDSKEGKMALNRANKRLAKMKGRLTPRRQFSMFGVGRQPQPYRRPVVGAYRPPGT